MADEPKERNKGGRPSKDPAGGKRPTITFRCRASLQEKLQTSSRAADRSVSEEIERRIEESFLLDGVPSIVEQAVTKATEAALSRENLENLKFFGGDYGFLWAKESADAYTAVFKQLAEEYSVKDNSDITEEFRAELVDRMKYNQEKISEMWFTKVRLAVVMPQVIEFMSGPGFKSLANNDPDVRAMIERMAKRKGIPSGLDEQ
ncbi:hypothetical protein [Methylobacterium sp. J-068]|uniref:hypothetical protein n=1 Tax=Methylobacterium sp. J-068 TaxID=2836649 RepID=UPI001FB9CE72|nr:hypothetical protein [Methylobacterium sp. J-068]MCJ2036392.1 hypothetical protein [Methylobacterium sp. J-068]